MTKQIVKLSLESEWKYVQTCKRTFFYSGNFVGGLVAHGRADRGVDGHGDEAPRGQLVSHAAQVLKLTKII
jgi:hypothetical protein